MRVKTRLCQVGMLLLAGLSIAMLSGCGHDTTLPADGIVTLDPDGYTLTATTVIPDVCISINVIAKFADGLPMEKAYIDIYGPLAFPDFAQNLYQFYDGTCPTDPALARTGHFTAVTDNHGIYTFSILINGASGTWFDKNIVVRSGVASAIFNLEKN